MAKDNPALDELRKLATGSPAAEPEPVEEPLAKAPEPEAEPVELEAAPEQPEEAPEPPQAAEDDEGDKPSSMPPGLRQEREKRKEAQRETESERQRNEQLQAQLRAMHEQMQQIQQSLQPKDDKPSDPVVDDPEPNRDEDFANWLAWSHRDAGRKLETQAKQTAELQEQLKQQQQREQQEAARRQIVSNYHQSAARALQQDPSFKDAYRYVVDQRSEQIQRQLAQQHPFATAAQIEGEVKRQIQQEEMQLAADATQKGQDPASVLLQTARGWGWQPSAAPAPTAETQPAAQTAPAEAPAPKKPAPPPKSLGNVGGRPSKGPMKPKEMAKLGISDFMQVYDTKDGRGMLRDALTNRA